MEFIMLKTFLEMDENSEFHSKKLRNITVETIHDGCVEMRLGYAVVLVVEEMVLAKAEIIVHVSLHSKNTNSRRLRTVS